MCNMFCGYGMHSEKVRSPVDSSYVVRLIKDRGKPTKPEPALSVPLGTTSGLSLIQFS